MTILSNLTHGVFRMSNQCNQKTRLKQESTEIVCQFPVTFEDTKYFFKRLKETAFGVLELSKTHEKVF